MSDDAEQYFNAWKNVFNTENTKKILCAWHVDRSWRRNLKNVSDTSMQTEVYHQLCMLLQEREESLSRPASDLEKLQPAPPSTALLWLNHITYSFISSPL